MKSRSLFDLAAKNYSEKKYEDAKSLLFKIDIQYDLHEKIKMLFSKIDSIEESKKVENARLEQAKRAEEIRALREIKNKIKELLDELLLFKNKSDFLNYGFSSGHKYDRWMKDVQKLKNIPEEKLLLKQGFVAGDLEMLGLEYASSRGRETEYSLWAKKTILDGLKK